MTLVFVPVCGLKLIYDEVQQMLKGHAEEIIRQLPYIFEISIDGKKYPKVKQLRI